MWSGWVGFWSAPEEGTSVALFRMALGACTLWTVGSVLWAGLATPLYVDAAYGGIWALDGTWLVDLLGGPTPTAVSALLSATLVGGLLTLVGLGDRLGPLLALLSWLALVSTAPHSRGGYDLLLCNGLWLLVLGGGTQTLSLDARLRTGEWRPERTVGAWFRYLVVFQLLLMYWTTGLQKLSIHWVPWGDLSALYDILMQPSWQRWGEPGWAGALYPLTQVATLVAWLWEVLTPVWGIAFLVSLNGSRRWTRGVRLGFAAVGVVFHATIFVLMEVGPFGPVSLAFYAALVHPWEWPGGMGGYLPKSSTPAWVAGSNDASVDG